MQNAQAQYPVSTVASLLKVSRAVALRLIKDGALAAERTPQGLRVEHDILTGWIEAQISAAAEEAHGLAKDPQKK